MLMVVDFERIVPLLIPLVAIVGGLVVGAIAVVSAHMAKMRQAELEAMLKQDMLNRGMSPDQIRQVLEAGVKGFDRPK